MGQINDKLHELGYPSNIEELIEESEGISLEETTPDYYIIWDNYDDNDRFLQINKTPEVKESYFELFGRNDIDLDTIVSFCKILPPILLMHLKKVYFVKETSDCSVLEEETPNHTFNFNNNAVGLTVYNDSTAIINLANLWALAAEEEIRNIESLGYSKGKKEIFENAVLQTLAHELFHLAQFNPLIEQCIDDGEEIAEEFCREFSY